MSASAVRPKRPASSSPADTRGSKSKQADVGAETAGLSTIKVITRFLPYTTKSRFPQHPWLVRAYLAFPPAWRLLGRQTLYLGRR